MNQRIQQYEQKFSLLHKIEKTKEEFIRNLRAFWGLKGLQNQKIPQIGGKELDLYYLYRMVVRFGGAKNVSEHKLWKDIVSDFGLPETCTSASFTLRNHYQKYLLEFEQKSLFGICEGDSDYISELTGRSKTKKRLMIEQEHGLYQDKKPRIPYGSGRYYQYQQSQQKFKDTLEIPPHILQGQVNYQYQQVPNEQMKSTSAKQTPNIKQLLTQLQNPLQEAFYLKKNRAAPTVGEIRRIILAFESREQSEVYFALNSLLIFSSNTELPLYFEQYPGLMKAMTIFIETILQNMPYISQKLIKQLPQSNLCSRITMNNQNNSNFSVLDLLKNNFDQKETIEQKPHYEIMINDFEAVSELELLEQLRTILMIVRNISFQKQNDQVLQKNLRLNRIVFALMLSKVDKDCESACLDIVSHLAKNITLSQFQQNYNYESSILIKYLFDVLSNSNFLYNLTQQFYIEDSIESALETFRRLIIIQENENYLEQKLMGNLEILVQLLLHPQCDIREAVLELLCFLSDLGMQTRVGLAKHPKCLLRLVALLSSGAGKCRLKTARLCAMILNNIAYAPAAKTFFQPYEKDLFIVAASDEIVSKMISNLIADLDSFN